MKAPPRIKPAPEALTAFATSTICSRLSTEQGPAMTWKCPPPIFLPQTSMTVSSGWNLRLAFLYGSWMRLTSATESIDLMSSVSSREVSPMRPRMVSCTPRISCTWKFICSKWLTISLTFCGAVPFFKIIIIRTNPFFFLFLCCGKAAR